MGKTIEVPRTKFQDFLEENGFKTLEDFAQDNMKKGKVMITTNIGMATLEEQLEALDSLAKWCKENNVNFPVPSCIPSFNLAIPKELREDTADSTGYMINSLEDYIAHQQIEGISAAIGNQVLFVPNALETTLGCVKAGITGVGTSCELSWNFEGCNDHVAYVMDTLRGLGILASKRKEGFCVTGYTEDGIGGNCVDCVSNVGYLLFERYIYEDLCGVIFYGGSGGLQNNQYY